MKILTIKFDRNDGGDPMRFVDSVLADVAAYFDADKMSGSGDTHTTSYSYTLTDAPVLDAPIAGDADCGPGFDLAELPS